MSETVNDLAKAPTDAEHRKKAKKATGVAVFGTFIEYYDFSVYGYVAATLAVVFFPSDDPTVGLLNTLLVFGSGFVVRPLGAVFFGSLGDRVGRRASLMASIGLMTLAAALTGFLPGYPQIGVAAPILLVLLRMLQGFSTGGEIGGATSYVHEWAPPHRRPLYISFIPSFSGLGKGSAAGMAALAATLLPPETMESWGWRIPFLLAVPLGIACLLLRMRIEDSPEFAASRQAGGTERKPFQALLSHHRPQLIKVVVIATAQNIAAYVGTVYVAVYLSSVLGFSSGQAASIVLIAVLTSCLLIPVVGRVGSRYGGKRVLITCYCVYSIVTVPCFLLMGQNSIGLAILGLTIMAVPYAISMAGTFAVMPELFPVRVRHTGIAFGHSVGAMIGGGAGPYLTALLITKTGSDLVPAYIIVSFAVLALAVLVGTIRTNTSDGHIYT